jgi:hypothetical protein
LALFTAGSKEQRIANITLAFHVDDCSWFETAFVVHSLGRTLATCGAAMGLPMPQSYSAMCKIRLNIWGELVHLFGEPVRVGGCLMSGYPNASNSGSCMVRMLGHHDGDWMRLATAAPCSQLRHGLGDAAHVNDSMTTRINVCAMPSCADAGACAGVLPRHPCRL